MKVILHIAKNNPTNVEEIILEDVASYVVEDSKITVHFNATPDEVFSIVNTEQDQNGEWIYMNITSTRIGLKIDMSQ